MADALGFDGQWGLQGTYARPGEGSIPDQDRDRDRDRDSDRDRDDRNGPGNYFDDRDGDGVPNIVDFDDGVGWADKAKPIVLDLSGDGIEITELSQSQVFVDANNDGLKNKIAWAGVMNGVLFYDPNDTGEITETRQFIFTEWDPTAGSDLEALKSVFDTNNDGELSGAELADFKLMVTLADGSMVAVGLDELDTVLGLQDITSIDLTGDATHIELPDGSVITGQTTFEWADGSSGTVGELTLAYDDESHRVEQVSATDGAGNLVVTSTGYSADGSIAFVMTSTTSPNGDQIDNGYDDNGDGVVDRLQSISKVTNPDGSVNETVTNSIGSDPASAVLVNRTVTHTSADGDTVTISRDSTGGGWFDQVEVRVTHGDDSRTITVEERAYDGSVIQSTVETVSADGLTRTEAIDRDGDGVTDLTITHVIVLNGDSSRTETTSTYNADGSLRGTVVETVSADGKVKTVSKDADGDGQFETVQDTAITVNGDGSTSSVLDVENADGSLRSGVVQTQSDDALVKVIAEDLDGDGMADRTTLDETVIHADGSRDRTVTVTNGDGSLRSKVKESLGADQVSSEMWEDLNRNGEFEASDLVKSVVVDGVTGARTTSVWDRNVDGSVRASSVSVASEDGLSVVTDHDIDGDGDVDAAVSDVTVVNGDGSTTRTVTTSNQDGSVRSVTVREASADGLTVTTSADIDGDGVVDAVSVVARAGHADGSRTTTTSDYAGDGVTLLSSTVLEESADRRQVTKRFDYDGDGIDDLVVVSVEADDGSVTVTETGYFDDGAVSHTKISTISDDGLVSTTTSDADGNGINESTVTDSTVLNADGSQTQTITIENGDGSLRSKIVTVTRDDAMVVTTSEDANGNGVYDRVTVTTKSYGVDGSVTTTTQTSSADGTVLGNEQVVVSDEDLTVTQSSDTDGDGSYDLQTETVMILMADGSTVETVEMRDSTGALRSKVTTTRSDDGRSVTIASDLNGDGHDDTIETLVEADDGTVTSTVTNYALDGSVESSSQSVTSDTGLEVEESHDLDGDGVFDQLVETLTTNNADGSTTTVSESQSANGTVSSVMEVDVSADGLTKITATDVDADGVAEFTVTEQTDFAVNGIETFTADTHAADGSLISNYERVTSADSNTVTETSDLDGNGVADDITQTVIAADGSTTQTSSYYSTGGGLEGTLVQITSGDGLHIRTELDRNGDGRVEFLTDDRTELGADGSVSRVVSYRDNHYRSLGSETYYQSDDGLFSSVSYDLDGDGLFEFISESTTVFEADGDVVTTIQTHDETGDVIAEETITESGDGLSTSVVTDFDGDGAFDRLDVTTRGADGGYTQVVEEFGTGAELASKTTVTVSADGFTKLTAIDLDGDGTVDQDYLSEVNADQSVTGTYRDLSELGLVENEIISTTSANGMDSSASFDVDGDGDVDFIRATKTSFDADGNEITTFSEQAADGTVIYQEVHTLSADGLTEITTFDVDGNGQIEGTRTTTTTINEDGSQDQVTQTVYANGGLRAEASVHTSADGRTITSRLDYDGNGIADKTSVQTISSDGEQVEVTKSFNEAGVLNSTFTTITSADGLTVTTIRDGADDEDTVESFVYSPAGDGSYVWVNGLGEQAWSRSYSQHIEKLVEIDESATHEIDANGIDTWTYTQTDLDEHGDPYQTSFTAQLDQAAKFQIFAEAERLYDTILDRGLDTSEREKLVKYVEEGQLDLAALADVLLNSGEFTTRYVGGSHTDAEFVTQLYLNSYGRAPSMKELASHLASLSGDLDPWTGLHNTMTKAELAIELAQSSEHIVIGNGHMSTNNFDVIMNPAVYERFLDEAYVEAMVRNMIDVAYDRDATVQEVSYLTELLLKDTDSPEDIAQKLLDVSGELAGQTTRSLSDLSGVDLINQAYLNAFGRLPEPEELSTWGDLLNGGHISAAQFVASLAQSAEHLATGNVHELGDSATIVTHTGDTGGNGADETLTGSSGIDKFAGGDGDDFLEGKGGSDIYQWSKGDGNDVINDDSNSLLETDTLVLTDVVSSDVALTRVQGTDDLLITIISTGEVIKDKERFLDLELGDGLEAIQFSDGVTWTLEDILGNTEVIGASGNDNLSGQDAFDEVFVGGNGKDTISGNDGDDLLIGGLALDVLKGGNGDDAYLWHYGDGNDTISDTGAALTDIDTLVFGDVAPDQVTLIRDPDDPENLIVEVANPFVQNGTQGVLYFEFYEIAHSQDTIAELPTTGATGLGLVAGTNVTALADEYGVVGNDDEGDKDTFAVRFFGTIEITESGDYTFELGSDDGSMLWINGQEVVNNDGLHPFETESGTITLSAGVHTVELAYFEQTQGEIFTVAVSGPDTDGELLELFESGLLGDASGADALLNADSSGYADFLAPPTTITITDQFAAMTNGKGIETIEFADGTIWTLSDILEMTGLHGTDGDDTINGTTYGDNFYGGDGNDTLDDVNTDGGDDRFVGGLGDDTLYGDDGSDIYIWSKGDGNDIVNDNGDAFEEIDTLVLTDVSSSDVLLRRALTDAISGDGNDNRNDLLLTILSTGEVIDIREQFKDAGVGHGVEKIVFGDGIVWSLEDIQAMTWVEGTSGDETLTGLSSFNENFLGLDGDDTLDANDGDDILVGGQGDDLLKGDDGSDIYIWELGDGDDTIDDTGISTEEIDVLEFSDISSLDVDLTQSGDDLIIDVDGGETLTVLDRFKANDVGEGIELLVFDDGVMVEVLASSAAQTEITGTGGADTLIGWGFVDHMYGGDGNDILKGGGGKDTLTGGDGIDQLHGGSGSDTYIWSKGDGNDIIDENGNSLVQVDTLKLIDVSSDDVLLSRDQGSDDLLITIVSTGEVIRDQDRFDDTDIGDGIDAIEFGDGVTWTLEDIFANTRVNGTSGNDTLTGEDAFDENFFGGAGDDTLDANSGNDVLTGGQGLDKLLGDDGSDTYVWSKGDGNDIIDENGDSLSEIDVLKLVDVVSTDISLERLFYNIGAGNAEKNDLRITILSTGEVIEIWDQFWNASVGDGIEAIEFSDGVIWTLEDIQAATSVNGTSGADELVGLSTFDENFFGGAGNDSIYGYAGDDTLSGDEGDDYLNAGSGDDTYIWQRGDGNDIIYDADTSISDTDRLVLTDVDSDEVLLRRVGNGIEIVILSSGISTGEVIYDTNTYHAPGYGYGLEVIEFADGVIWNQTEIFANTVLEGSSAAENLFGSNKAADNIYGFDGDDGLYGYDNDDNLFGGLGDDYLVGDDGSDTYFWAIGDGNDVIDDNGDDLSETDTLILADVTSDDVTLSRDPGSNHLKITIISTGEVIEDRDTFADPGKGDGLERIVFADGVIWTISGGLDALHISGTASSEHLIGLDGNDTILGHAGDDTLSGGMGDDHLDGGDGMDNLYGGEGDDTLAAGTSDIGGWSYLYGGVGDDTYLIEEGSLRTSILAVAEDANSGMADTIVFENLTLDDVSFDFYDYTQGGTVVSDEGIALVLTWDQNGEQAKLYISNMGDAIESFVFSDGTELSSISVDHWTHGRDRLSATSGDDVIYSPSGTDWAYVKGLEGHDTLMGGDGKDYLFGGAGNDVLSAGGNAYDDNYQVLKGEEGNDTYLISSGDEKVLLTHTSEIYEMGSQDQIVFTDLNLSDLTLSTHDYTGSTTGSQNYGIALDFSWTGGNLRIANEGENIETFVFEDGTTMTLSEVLDLM